MSNSGETLMAELDSRLQKQINEAADAIAREAFDYAISVTAAILSKWPGVFEARLVLWNAILKGQRVKARGTSGLFSQLTGCWFRFSKKKYINPDPVRVIREVDSSLAKGLFSEGHFQLLLAAANQLGWKETAAQAAFMIVDLKPESSRHRLVLGDTLLKTGRPAEAVDCAQRVLEREPGNVEAQALLKHASVADTVKRANWEASASLLERLEKMKS